MYTVQNMDNTL